jgi:hypothetical protein
MSDTFSWKFTSQYFVCNDTTPRQFMESNQQETPIGALRAE